MSQRVASPAPLYNYTGLRSANLPLGSPGTLTPLRRTDLTPRLDSDGVALSTALPIETGPRLWWLTLQLTPLLLSQSTVAEIGSPQDCCLKSHAYRSSFRRGTKPVRRIALRGRPANG